MTKVNIDDRVIVANDRNCVKGEVVHIGRINGEVVGLLLRLAGGGRDRD